MDKEEKRISENEKECPEYYANEIHVSASNMDISVAFSRLTDMKTSGARIERFLCRVFMSPKYAKTLYTLLGKAIDAYEKENTLESHEQAHD